MVLSVFGTEGNVNSVIAIARELEARGVEPVLVTHSVYASQYRQTEFEIVGVDGDRDFVAMDAAIHLLNAPHQVPTFFRDFVMPFSAAEAMVIAARAVGRDAVLVTTDSPGIGARIAAEIVAAPLVTLFQAPGFLYARPLYGAMLERYLRPELIAMRAHLGVTTPLPPGSDWIAREALALALWPSWFERPRNVPAPAHAEHVGFVRYERAFESVATCSEIAAVDVIVTGGSASVSTRAFYAAALQGCEHAGLSVLVVTPHESLLPPQYLGHANWRRWIDLPAVLPRTRCVIHHGGIGTIVDALCAGVPQLVLADGGDRPENAKVLEAIGVGRYLNKTLWQPDVVSEVLAQILCSTMPMTSRACAAAARAATGSVAAATAISALLPMSTS